MRESRFIGFGGQITRILRSFCISDWRWPLSWMVQVQRRRGWVTLIICRETFSGTPKISLVILLNVCLMFLGFQMADQCVKLFHCGTHATGWLKNGHPTQSEGAVAREVCFHWRDDCCYFRQQIMVRRCEHFYIYKFPRMDISYLRYCGKGSVMDNHWLTH